MIHVIFFVHDNNALPTLKDDCLQDSFRVKKHTNFFPLFIHTLFYIVTYNHFDLKIGSFLWTLFLTSKCIFLLHIVLTGWTWYHCMYLSPFIIIQWFWIDNCFMNITKYCYHLDVTLKSLMFNNVYLGTMTNKVYKIWFLIRSKKLRGLVSHY